MRNRFLDEKRAVSISVISEEVKSSSQSEPSDASEVKEEVSEEDIKLQKNSKLKQVIEQRCQQPEFTPPEPINPYTYHRRSLSGQSFFDPSQTVARYEVKKGAGRVQKTEVLGNIEKSDTWLDCKR